MLQTKRYFPGVRSTERVWVPPGSILSPSLRSDTPAPSSLMSPAGSVGYAAGSRLLLKISSSCGTVPLFTMVRSTLPACIAPAATTVHSSRVTVGPAVDGEGPAEEGDGDGGTVAEGRLVAAGT